MFIGQLFELVVFSNGFLGVRREGSTWTPPDHQGAWLVAGGLTRSQARRVQRLALADWTVGPENYSGDTVRWIRECILPQAWIE
jgi:hypothetical protein